ncbi:MAG: hypothetical protein DRI61_05200 [Chloroflexi bacterium]|nr:MAG: hypothetical protein DRI61_05200 [Chloroflexota bacterium]HDN80081.1 hypothetical protein [Chloroflexota bacterium]
MAYTVVIHVIGEEPIMAEMDKLPDPADNCVICTGVRRRDGKPVEYVMANVDTVIFPWHRISVIEVLPSEVEKEEVVEFFRE